MCAISLRQTSSSLRQSGLRLQVQRSVGSLLLGLDVEMQAEGVVDGHLEALGCIVSSDVIEHLADEPELFVLGAFKGYAAQNFEDRLDVHHRIPFDSLQLGCELRVLRDLLALYFETAVHKLLELLERDRPWLL